MTCIRARRKQTSNNNFLIVYYNINKMVADAVAASVLLLIVFLVLFAIKRWYGIGMFHENSAMQKINSRPPVLDVVNVDKPFSIELGKQPFENGICPCYSPLEMELMLFKHSAFANILSILLSSDSNAFFSIAWIKEAEK